jgi:2-dehydro-3-deoxy-D-arabinonate dehydratase
MRFVRFNLPQSGPRLGYINQDEQVIDLTGATGGRISSFLELLEESMKEGCSAVAFAEKSCSTEPDFAKYNYAELARVPFDEKKPHLILPLIPPEVWAAGVTYKRSVEARMEESQVKDVYDRVYIADRPELFFKSTAARVVGHGDTIGLRSDSNCIVPEPELGLVLGPDLKIVGYIIGNDVTSRDVEGENPLYLPQAKIFNNSCSLGPIIATADEIADPYNLEIKCEIYRDRDLVFSGEANTSQLNRKFEKLIDYLGRNNPIFPGTVLLTGTCIVPPETFTLISGDIVNISIDHLGVLTNQVS